MNRSNSKNESGYVLLGVLVLLSLGLIVTVGMLDSAATNTKTRALVKTRADYFYEVEETLNRVVVWLQSNSKNIVGAFTEENFNDNFDLGDPALGDNEGEHFGVYTMVKMKNSNDSVMLSNNEFFGTSAFPTTTHITSGASFDPVSAFESADLGEANARVVLVWARDTAGNYEPIFRVDVVTGNNPDRGVHSFSYIYTTLEATPGGVGFYGRDWLTLQTPNNDCYSYQYTYNSSSNSWNRGAPRSNCPVGSNGMMNISSKVYGTAKTLRDEGISFNPPGGDASGGTCMGEGCHSATLPSLNTWAGYCPSHNGNATIASNTTWSSGGCWQDVQINNNRTLTLTDYNTPYYFRNIVHNGNHAKLNFGPVPPGEKIKVYFESITANSLHHINGNKVLNGNNAPHQVEFYYLGSNELQLEGTTDMHGFLYSPNAPVRIQGNFNYYGGIFATSLYLGGNARINYDESYAPLPSLNDMNFALRKASQRYR